MPNPLFASRPCYLLPNYVDEFKNRYERVEIKQDNCYPGYSFYTPSYYSMFEVTYFVDTGIIDAENIGEYDSRLRERIIKAENCPGVAKYLELAKELQISGYPYFDIPILYFIDFRIRETCTDLNDSISFLETQEIIANFLKSQKRFGDYTLCVQKSNGNINYDNLRFNALCDNKFREDIRLVLKNNEPYEAYFENSYSEVYRKIYPDDQVIRERKPAREQMEKTKNIIRVIGIVILILVIGGVFVLGRMIVGRKK